MADIVIAAYEKRRSEAGLSARAPIERPDIRLHVDEQGELYITSKVDGVIRAITGAHFDPAF